MKVHNQVEHWNLHLPLREGNFPPGLQLDFFQVIIQTHRHCHIGSKTLGQKILRTQPAVIFQQSTVTCFFFFVLTGGVGSSSMAGCWSPKPTGPSRRVVRVQRAQRRALVMCICEAGVSPSCGFQLPNDTHDTTRHPKKITQKKPLWMDFPGLLGGVRVIP